MEGLEIIPASIPPEVGIEKLSTKLTVNALSMKKADEFGIGKIIVESILVI